MGRIRHDYSDGVTRLAVYAALLINQGNLKKTARETGLPESTVRRWRNEFNEIGHPPVVRLIGNEDTDALALAVGRRVLRTVDPDVLLQAAGIDTSMAF